MNGIKFFIDDNDRIYKCISTFDVRKRNYEHIVVSQNSFYEIFRYLTEKYPDFKEKVYDDHFTYTFTNIDNQVIRTIVNESKEYQRNKVKTKLKSKRNSKRKVTRKNMIGVKYAAFSLAALLVLNSFVSANKPTIEEVKDEQDSVVFDEEFFINDIPEYIDENIVHYDVHNGIYIPAQDEMYIDQIIDETHSFDSSINNLDVAIPEENTIDIASPIISLDIKDSTDSEKYLFAKESYFSVIEKYAKQYGLDPNLVLALVTQERGIHSTQVDSGGGLGLCQIQIDGDWNWNNKEISAYNFNTNSWENAVIKKEEIKGLEQNVKIGCMLLQITFREQNYNIPRAIQAYNYGSSYMNNVVNACSYSTGCTFEELNDPTNLSWLDYRSIIKSGDPYYLENVLQYVPDGTNMEFRTPDNEVITLTFNNLSQNQVL